eukprot:2551917-Pleurochrysis_carterae.AAC.2
MGLATGGTYRAPTRLLHCCGRRMSASSVRVMHGQSRSSRFDALRCPCHAATGWLTHICSDPSGGLYPVARLPASAVDLRLDPPGDDAGWVRLRSTPSMPARDAIVRAWRKIGSIAHSRCLTIGAQYNCVGK